MRLPRSSFSIGPAIFRAFLAALAISPVLFAPVQASAFDADSDGISDESDAFPCKAPSASVQFAPAQGAHGLLMMEDQWPEQADLDFNDAVLTYNYIFETDSQGRVLSVRATYNMLAVGGEYNNGLGLHLPVPTDATSRVKLTIAGRPSVTLSPMNSSAELTVPILSNMREVFGNEAGTINSDPSKPSRTSVPLEVEITFSTPVSLDMGQAPFDVYLFRTDGPSHEIHRPEFSGTDQMNQGLFHTGVDGSTLSRHFVDTSGLPYVLVLPGIRPWPREGVSIEHLYPNILGFAASGGTQNQDFYDDGVDLEYAYGWTAAPQGSTDQAPVGAWQPPFLPAFVGPDNIPADTACVNAWGLSVQFGTARDTFGYGSAIDPSGNIIVTGYTRRALAGASNSGAEDIFVAKYNRQTGALLWSKEFGGTASDTGRSVAVDASGNIYVAGETRSSFGAQSNAGLSDAFLMRLDTNGNLGWVRYLGGTGYDYATGIAVDSSGGIYVAGGANSASLSGTAAPGTGPSSFIARFDNTGTRTWLQRYRFDSANASNYDYIADLAIDSSNNLVVTGSERRYNQNPAAAENPFVAKLRSTDGSRLWVQHIGDYGYYEASVDYRLGHGLGVATDSVGNIFMTGSWESGSQVSTWGAWNRAAGDTTIDMTLTKLDTNGSPLWNQSVGSTNGRTDVALDPKTDAAGNVYVVGYTGGVLQGQSSVGAFDYIASRVNADGSRSWTVQSGSTTDDGAFGAVVYPSEGLYIVGNTGNVVAGTPVLFQNAFYGFIARHSLNDGTRGAYVSTVDTDLTQTSCQAVLAAGASTGSGIYTIDPDGVGGSIAPFDVYCDMTTEGGGWTLVATMANDANNYWTWVNYPFVGNRTTGTLATALTKDFQSPAWSYMPGRQVLFKADNSASKYLRYDSIINYQTLQSKYPAKASPVLVGTYTPAVTVGSWWYQCSSLEMRLVTADSDGGNQAGTDFRYEYANNGVGFVWRSSNNDGCNWDDTFGSLTTTAWVQSMAAPADQEGGWTNVGSGPYNTGYFFYRRNMSVGLNVFVR